MYIYIYVKAAFGYSDPPKKPGSFQFSSGRGAGNEVSQPPLVGLLVVLQLSALC